jgi:cold shock CspA family protein
MERFQGTIAVWIPTRAFGFIVIEDPKNFRKVFFHLSHVAVGVDRIAVGAKATFGINPIREGKNLSAIEIEVLGVGGVA